MKSENIQYNMLGCWVDWTIISFTKRLMSKYYFFFHKILCKNPFNFFYNFTKIKIKSLGALSPSQQTTVLFSIYQNNAWTIRRLANQTIDPVTQLIILKIIGFVVYFRCQTYISNLKLTLSYISLKRRRNRRKAAGRFLKTVLNHRN